MGSFFVSLFSILVLGAVSCSRPPESAQITQARVPSQEVSAPGVLLRHSPSLPVAVRNAADSVFRLVVHWDTAFEYEKLSYAKSSAYLEENCSSGAQDFLQTLNCEAVRRCFSEMQATSSGFCYAPYMTGGTAWVAKATQERSVLVTNWHVFQRQFAPQMFLAPAIVQRPPAERKKLLQQLEPIFSLYNSEGKLVYKSTGQAVAPRIVGMGDVLGAAFSKPSVQAVASLVEDYVAVEVPLAIGRPLTIASESPSVEAPAFAVGYPVSTRGRIQHSDGHQLYFSQGHFYSSDQFFELVEPLAKASAQNESAPAAEDLSTAIDYVLPDRGFVYSSCDVVGGNSGGPLLNSRGQVVGMVARSYSNEDKYEPAGSVSLFIPHLGGALSF